MLKVGITGGIGSGKSVICKVFSSLGIPVFDADAAAKHLIHHDRAIIESVKALFGPEIYFMGRLDNARVSTIIFNEPEKRARMNGIVHPATILFAREWQARQTAPYTLKEAALFFEAGTNTEIDVMIGVYAPVTLRVQRAMHRSGMSAEQVYARMNSQMNEEEKMKRCDYVVVNDDIAAVLPQILRLDSLLRGGYSAS